MQEIGKFDANVNVIPNVLEKYMTFAINKNSVLLVARNFLTLVQMHWLKICPIMIFKYLLQEFSGNMLE